jgi:Fe-S cluster biogenesis protein NfuA
VSADSPSDRSSNRVRPPPPPDRRAKVLAVCREVVAPLVRADGGEVYLVAAQADAISLHLAGTCAGCPGARITAAAVIEPAIRAVDPTVRVTVTAGILIPAGAVPIDTADAT